MQAIPLLVSAGLLACTTTATPGSATAPEMAELMNASYGGVDAHARVITLRNGRWEGEPATPGAASRPTVELAGGLRVTGDLDGDGKPEAAAVLTHSTGGSGALSYLAVVRREAGTTRNVATVLLGDRVQIRSVRIDAGRIHVNAVRAGEADPACCGGELVEWQWVLRNDRLTAIATTVTGRLSLDTLSGTQWFLQAWNIGEPVDPAPTVTLAYEADHFTGTSGCNRYSTGAGNGGIPGEIHVGPIVGTRMACPERESRTEARFLAQLSGARRFGFLLGRLAIGYESADGTPGTMIFEAR